jgi:Leucine-rich repeat (LRR) protein
MTKKFMPVMFHYLNCKINFFHRDFAHKLSLALIANNSTPLHTLDLSNNMIEDKGKM